MCRLLTGLLAGCLFLGEVRGEGAEAPANDPKVLLGIISTLEKCGIDELTSGRSRQEQDTYHLRTVSYLGTVTWKGQTITLATAFYIRSRLPGRDTPPARGHGFILCLDADTTKVISHARMDYAAYHLDGEVLKLENQPLIDFGNHDEVTRYKGYLAGGADLAYPFADRISEADWESGAFRKKDR